MKISKKIFSFLTAVLVLAATLTFTNKVSAKAATNDVPVQLYYSSSVSDTSETSHYVGYIAVKNLAYDKKVTAHYNYTGAEQTTVWNDIAATYVRTNPLDGNEIWKFETPSTFNHYGFGEIQYAIKYEVNGQTYWDNNGGKNYRGIDFAASRPHVTSFGGYQNNLTCNLEIKKPVKPEAVRIRYTDDNWATYKEVDAATATQEYGILDVNYWVANIPVSSGKQIKFSAYYVINGVQYWDNNLGENYSYNN